VNVADQLPAGTTFVSASVTQSSCSLSLSGLTCTSPPQGRPCSFDGTTVNCNVGLLTRFSFQNLTGAVIQLTVNVNAPVGTKIRDTATVNEVNFDPFPGNNSSTAVTLVIP